MLRKHYKPRERDGVLTWYFGFSSVRMFVGYAVMTKGFYNQLWNLERFNTTMP